MSYFYADVGSSCDTETTAAGSGAGKSLIPTPVEHQKVQVSVQTFWLGFLFVNFFFLCFFILCFLFREDGCRFLYETCEMPLSNRFVLPKARDFFWGHMSMV